MVTKFNNNNNNNNNNSQNLILIHNLIPKELLMIILILIANKSARLINMANNRDNLTRIGILILLCDIKITYI